MPITCLGKVKGIADVPANLLGKCTQVLFTASYPIKRLHRAVSLPLIYIAVLLYLFNGGNPEKIPFQFEMVELIPLPWNLFMSLANQEVDSVAKKVASRMATEPTERTEIH